MENNSKVKMVKKENGAELKTPEEKKDAIQKAVPNKDISDSILKRVTELEQSGGLDMPGHYSFANALKSAWLVLQQMQVGGKPVLEVCTSKSVANALLDMIIQGLSVAKKQCYFIPYGKVLTLSRSYLGTIAVTKRLKDVEDVFARPIFEGDVLEYTINPETGNIKIIKHEQKFENINIDKIVGAYAIVVRKGNAENYVEIMTKDQIKKAWEQGAMKGNSPAHKNFTDEMSKKTVINRACKTFFNTSDDSDILIESINRTADAEDGLKETQYEEIVENEIEENANSKELDVHISDEETNLELEPELELESSNNSGRDF